MYIPQIKLAHKWHVACIFTFILVCAVGQAKSDSSHSQNGSESLPPNLLVLHLYGSFIKMGIDYGQVMEGTLRVTYQILVDYFITEQGMTYEEVLSQAMLFHSRMNA